RFLKTPGGIIRLGSDDQLAALLDGVEEVSRGGRGDDEAEQAGKKNPKDRAHNTAPYTNGTLNEADACKECRAGMGKGRCGERGPPQIMRRYFAFSCWS